jgi:hypothetical protein
VAEVGEEARRQPAADDDLEEHLAGAPVVLVVVEEVRVRAREGLERPAAPLSRRLGRPAAVDHRLDARLPFELHRAHTWKAPKLAMRGFRSAGAREKGVLCEC